VAGGVSIRCLDHQIAHPPFTFLTTNTTDHCFVPFLLPPSCLGLTDSRFRVSLLSRIASSNGHASWCIQIYKAVYGIYLINCAGSLSFGDYFKGGLSPCCRSYSPLPAWRIRWPYSLLLWLVVIRPSYPFHSIRFQAVNQNGI